MAGETYEDVGPFITQANNILDKAKGKGVTLRILGAIAFNIHCPKYNYIQKETKRFFTDIDFMSYVEQKKQVEQLFVSMGYVDDPVIKTVPGVKRSIFHSRTDPWHSDVFYDTLDFSHEIPFRGRLDLDFPTISLVDMLLEKMQIAKLNEKDAIDTIMIFREHDLGNHNNETIDIEYLARLLKADWGLWKTVTTNLQHVDVLMDKYGVLTDDDKSIVREKIGATLARIDKESATLKWKMRARVGERVKWYREVDEVMGG